MSETTTTTLKPTISRDPLFAPPRTAPLAAYSSNQNIYLQSGCAPLISPRIVMKASANVACTWESSIDTSWGPQLNFWTPPGGAGPNPETFLQVTPYIQGMGDLNVFIEGWGPHGMIFGPAFTLFAAIPGDKNVLPPGWAIDWTTITDPVTNIVTKVQITVLDAGGATFVAKTLNLAQWSPYLTPVSVMTLAPLGANGAYAIFSSGAGAFQYSLGGGQLMNVVPNPPALPCVADPLVHTGEQCNLLYEDIRPRLPANTVTQQFGLTLGQTVPTSVAVRAQPH